MQKPTTPNPHYAALNAELRVLCDDFHYATLRTDVAVAVAAWQKLTPAATN